MPAPIKCLLLPLFVAALIPCVFAQQPTVTPSPSPTRDTSVIDANGTAHITRVVPLPSILSDEAKAFWSHPVSDAAKPQTLAERRAGTDAWQLGAGKKSAAVYPVKITEGEKIAGVPVRIVDPLPGATRGPLSDPGKHGICDPTTYSVLQHRVRAFDQMCAIDKEPIHPDRVLICLHGGGFNSDSGSYTESIPIANLTRTRVVSVLYRLSPEHPYPAALDDAVAVYKELLKTYKPANIAIYGTSAGAILTGEVAVRLKQLHLPEPGALGIFSGFGDSTAVGDSAAFFALNGLSGHLDPPAPNPDHHSIDTEYTGTADPHGDVLSPNYSDLHDLPPTLFVTSTRDMLLSGTADMDRAWMRDGVPTQMIVFDGLPHAFWNDVSLPESREAYAAMARFFRDRLGN
jgi:monoterpene epsilon-lactone hydrolase